MAKILTLTLNPALDLSTRFTGLVAEQKLRCENPRYDPGGGGINVSKAIKKLGGESLAIFAAGGFNGQIFEDLFADLAIEYQKVSIEQNTRINFTSLDLGTHQQYRFTAEGPTFSKAENDEILATVKASKAETLVLSGSLPNGIQEDFYAEIAHFAAKNDKRLILDTSGKALETSMGPGIFLTKPNIDELAKLVNAQSLEIDEIDEAAQQLIAAQKTKCMVVSLGAQGAVWVNKDGYGRIPAPSIKANSTVGAGDSMVAGITYALAAGNSLDLAAVWGVACGSAATMNTGTQLFHYEDVLKLKKWIEKTLKKDAKL